MEPQEYNSTPASSAPAATLASLASNIPFAILIAAAMISGSILYTRSGSLPSDAIANIGGDGAQAVATPTAIKDPSVLSDKNDASLGKADAKVTIVEFSDFQCPFCRSFFQGAYGQIKKDYIDTGKVRLVFRHFPLSFHPAARPSALAAECAGDQGKFWQFHDKMFTEQEKKGTGTVSYGIAELKTWASQIGLDSAKFNSCLDGEKYASKVDTDTAAGSKYGVSGTPSFFINGKLLVGAQPFAKFKELIDSAL